MKVLRSDRILFVVTALSICIVLPSGRLSSAKVNTGLQSTVLQNYVSLLDLADRGSKSSNKSSNSYHICIMHHIYIYYTVMIDYIINNF